jgi:hypothetical protein
MSGNGIVDHARQIEDESARGIGKRTLTETAFAAPALPAPGKRTLTEDVAIQRRAERDAAADAGPPPAASGGAQLPPDLRTSMESLLGTDLTSVRIHQTPYAQAIGARAFTRGDDLYFAPGAYAPRARKVAS